MLKCKKCSGRVFLDTTFSTREVIELYCLMCGVRWNLSTKKDKFAAWLKLSAL